MSKSIVELIAEESSAKVVSTVERMLSKKLIQAISEQKSAVARQAYGSLQEAFGGDEPPEFANRDDNAYATFFANALKKFGVTGPEDFQDEQTKKQFFDYVDANWRAQDSVQGQSAVSSQGRFDVGSQTQLPAQAGQPMQNNMQSGNDANDPSVATMAPAGPSVDKTQPLGPDGDDEQFDAAQGNAPMGDMPMGQMGGGAPQQQQRGIPCPHCNGTGIAPTCPCCGRPMDDMDQDPDLEITDDDQADDEMPNFGDEPEDEKGFGGKGKGRFGGDDDLDNGDASEFEGGDEEGEDGDFPPDGDEGDGEYEEDQDPDADGDDEEEDGDGEYEDDGEEDPDLEISDDDEDQDEGDEEGDDEPGSEVPFPMKKRRSPFTEAELLEYGNMAALESKIKVLKSQIDSQGDKSGQRRQALRKLEDQLKARKQ